MATRIRAASRGAAVAAAGILVVLSALPAAASAPVRASDAAAPGGRLIVLWRTASPGNIGIAGVRRTEATAASQRSVVVAQAGRAGIVAAELRNDPRVLAVVPDARVRALGWPNNGEPSDPLFPEQEDLPQIGVPDAWPTTTGDPDVVVAVIDTGVDLDHPDLDGVHVTDPHNEIWNNTDVFDGHGHGTHVAGTIVARADNATGIAGIAPDTTLMPIKVLDDEGFGSFSDVLDGVDWARTHGADIINLSLGGTLDDEQLALVQPTFTAARTAGILIVAAAGNSATPMMQYPAGLNGVLSVAAVDAGDAIAEFSTFNRAVDISAPGVDTLSTTAGDYERWSGTSMASPHVAGVAALVWADRPGLSVAKVEAVLRSSAVDLGDPGWDRYYGDGRVDAAAALDASVPSPLPELDPAPGPTDPFVIEFTSPSAPVRQTSTRFTVNWTTSHEVWDGFLLRYTWRMVNRTCPDPFWAPYVDFAIFPLDAPQAQRLAAGFCYRYEALAMDQDGRIADVLSESVSILDLVRPTIRAHSPRSNATGVGTRTSMRVVFSEPVKGVSGATLRLKNLTTGRWVTTRVTYNASTRTATIDPALSMFHGHRYAVYASSRIRDLSGNALTATHWSFRTAP
ncbi:MAG TPA: S8 family serine peptidase [Candidatus Limnocylindrales bacterium]